MLSYLRKKTKSIMIVVAVVFAASMFYGLGKLGMGGGGQQSDNSLAKVNGQQIDPLRFREIMSRMAGQFGGQVSLHDAAFLENMALSQTIDFTLILKQAKGQVKVPNSEVRMALEQMMKQSNIQNEKQLEQTLKRAGLTMKTFKKLLKDEMLVQKMVTKVRSDVKVTPDDLREVKASHILVSQEALAKELLSRIKKGEDFVALAGQYSQDPGSAAKGGDLGFFKTGMMVEPFEKAAFSLKIGEMSGLVKSPFGYHIIKVTDSKVRQADKAGEDLEKTILAEKQQNAFQQWYGKIRQKANIEITNPRLKGHQYRFSGKLREAIDEYAKAAAQNPGDPFIKIALGDVYATLGQQDQALAEYEAATALDAGNPQLYFVLAEALEKVGKKAEAIAQYKKASLIAGDNKAAHEQLRDKFKALGAGKEMNAEKAEIVRIDKKAAFEKSIGVQVGPEETKPTGQ